jgi:hypothetical protein
LYFHIQFQGEVTSQAVTAKTSGKSARSAKVKGKRAKGKGRN